MPSLPAYSLRQRSAVAVNTEMGRSHSAMGLLVALGAVLLTGGCAAMSETQCMNADWRLVGEQDGRAGRAQTRLSEYFKTCAQYGITPDRDEYTTGYEFGLTFYCTEHNGYLEGRSGRLYQGVCPAGQEGYFLGGYSLGDSVRRGAYKVERIQRRILDAEDEIKNLKREIEELESPQEAGESDEEEKDSDDAQTTGSLKEKYRTLGRLEGELEQLRDREIEVIVEYRRAVDEARRNGFHERYAY